MFDNLKSWTIEFVKHKDIFTKNLVDYAEKEDSVEFNFKDKKHIYVIKEVLEDSIKNKIKEDYFSIVCLNKKDNVEYLIKNWAYFIKFQKLNILFVNLKTNERWIIYPNTHNSLTEGESIKSGLNTLFQSIAPVK
jgi:hypothetical protein